MNATYQRLLELAQREWELITDGRFDELAELDTERAELVDELPPVPPGEAGPVLEEAAAQQEHNTSAPAQTLDYTNAPSPGDGRLGVRAS